MRASRSRSAQSSASAGLIPASMAARRGETSLASTEAAQANRVADVPSRSSRVTRPLPRAAAPSSRSRTADSSAGFRPRSHALAISSVVS